MFGALRETNIRIHIGKRRQARSRPYKNPGIYFAELTADLISEIVKVICGRFLLQKTSDMAKYLLASLKEAMVAPTWNKSDPSKEPENETNENTLIALNK
jgi:hypothetical protein